MSVEAQDLRAICARCGKVVTVRRQGKAWRMVAHQRVSSGWRNDQVHCAVKDIDALPMIRAWVDSIAKRAQEHAERASYLRAEIAQKTAEAEQREAYYAARLARHGGLIQLLNTIAPSPAAPAIVVTEADR